MEGEGEKNKRRCETKRMMKGMEKRRVINRKGWLLPVPRV
jgi:hypothetical protein